MNSPKQAYDQRLETYSKSQKELNVANDRFAIARGITFALFVAVAWLSLFNDSLSPGWLLIPFVLFLVLMVAHSRVVSRLARSRRAIDYYNARLGQLAGKWSGMGSSGARYCNDDHPYTTDMDVFGVGSLFELVCCARTRLGEDVLARWFSSAADQNTILERQQAITELRGQVEFRERFALLDAEINANFDQQQLQQWVEAKSEPIANWKRVLATVLGVLAVVSIAAWSLGYGYLPLVLVIVIEMIFYATNIREFRRITADADKASSGLVILSQVMGLIEEHKFTSKVLQELQNKLQIEGKAPSWQINRLHSLILMLDNSFRNQLFAPIAFLLCIPVHLIYRVEKWREQIGPHCSQWADTVGQIEALNSLSRHAFENPDDPFPDLVTEEEGACFEAIALGHPLLPLATCVQNDISINARNRLTMISGSNMSGKSTLLRTVGINLVLALCGAPVRAKSFRTSQFLLGCAMHAGDSLKQGTSLFYAVISRIKTIVELAGQSPPLLFLFDEILQGTNSHDRRVGAEGVIRQLLHRDAFGLVTTHDLALTSIADSLGDQAVNIHFEDNLINGKMHFDYKIRQGVVQKSNALELMRLIGLNVGDELSADISKKSNDE